MTKVASADDVAALIRSHRFTYQDEAGLQLGLATVLEEHGHESEREVPIAALDRIDFLVGRLGVEVKTKGTAANVARQLQCYARSDRIDELILVTTRAHHASFLPAEIGGKPLTVVWIGGQL